MAALRSPLPLADVGIVGGGPAAALLVLACAGRGLSVRVVAPGGLGPSRNTLCAFAHELPDALVSERFPLSWALVNGQRHALPPYAQLDNPGLADKARGNAVVVDDVVTAIEATKAGATLVTAGAAYPCRVVIDCSGATSTLTARDGQAALFQSAFGRRVRGRDDGLPPGTALFMDWTPAPVVDDGPPSFLYALAHGDGTLLLEETVLASAGPVPMPLLAHRLAARLVQRGTLIDAELATEEVCIPLDTPLPTPTRSHAAFGAAAGLIHPASGFSIASAARLAPQVAAAIVDGLAQNVSPATLAMAVQERVWTRKARWARALQLAAVASSLQLRGPAAAAAFFQAFFSLPTGLSSAWLSADVGVGTAAQVMWRLFCRLPGPERAALISGLGRRPGTWGSTSGAPSVEPTRQPSRGAA